MSLTPDPVSALRAALLAQNPNADWNAGGVDRAAELAVILNSKGITDLSKLGVKAYDGSAWNNPAPKLEDYLGKDTGGESGHVMGYNEALQNYQADLDAYNSNKSLTYGDQTFGLLTDPYSQGALGRGNQFAWSAAGDGNVGYHINQNPDGTYSIGPSWGSSSDWGTARKIAKAAATMAAIGGTAGLAAGAFGGAGLGALSGGDALAAAAGDVGFDAGLGGLGGAGSGAFLGEGVASGIPAWDAAAGSGVLGGAGAAGSAAGFPGEGAVSGVPAWDAAPGSGVLGSAAGGAASAVTPSAGSGLLGQAGDFLKNNPQLGRLIGAGLGGLLGRAISGPPDSSGSGTQSVNMNARAMTPGTSTLMNTPPSQGMPSGLGSSSAGLFDEYMKKQLGGGRRIFSAPTFGGG